MHVWLEPMIVWVSGVLARFRVLLLGNFLSPLKTTQRPMIVRVATHSKQPSRLSKMKEIALSFEIRSIGRRVEQVDHQLIELSYLTNLQACIHFWN